jgi:hypothetical protein
MSIAGCSILSVDGINTSKMGADGVKQLLQERTGKWRSLKLMRPTTAPKQQASRYQKAFKEIASRWEGSPASITSGRMSQGGSPFGALVSPLSLLQSENMFAPSEADDAPMSETTDSISDAFVTQFIKNAANARLECQSQLFSKAPEALPGLPSHIETQNPVTPTKAKFGYNGYNGFVGSVDGSVDTSMLPISATTASAASAAAAQMALIAVKDSATTAFAAGRMAWAAAAAAATIAAVRAASGACIAAVAASVAAEMSARASAAEAEAVAAQQMELVQKRMQRQEAQQKQELERVNREMKEQENKIQRMEREETEKELQRIQRVLEESQAKQEAQQEALLAKQTEMAMHQQRQLVAVVQAEQERRITRATASAREDTHRAAVLTAFLIPWHSVTVRLLLRSAVCTWARMAGRWREQRSAKLCRESQARWARLRKAKTQLQSQLQAQAQLQSESHAVAVAQTEQRVAGIVRWVGALQQRTLMTLLARLRLVYVPSMHTAGTQTNHHHVQLATRLPGVLDGSTSSAASSIVLATFAGARATPARSARHNFSRTDGVSGADDSRTDETVGDGADDSGHCGSMGDPFAPADSFASMTSTPPAAMQQHRHRVQFSTRTSTVSPSPAQSTSSSDCHDEGAGSSATKSPGEALWRRSKRSADCTKAGGAKMDGVKLGAEGDSNFAVDCFAAARSITVRRIKEAWNVWRLQQEDQTMLENRSSEKRGTKTEGKEEEEDTEMREQEQVASDGRQKGVGDAEVGGGSWRQQAKEAAETVKRLEYQVQEQQQQLTQQLEEQIQEKQEQEKQAEEKQQQEMQQKKQQQLQVELQQQQQQQTEEGGVDAKEVAKVVAKAVAATEAKAKLQALQVECERRKSEGRSNKEAEIATATVALRGCLQTRMHLLRSQALSVAVRQWASRALTLKLNAEREAALAALKANNEIEMEIRVLAAAVSTAPTCVTTSTPSAVLGGSRRDEQREIDRSQAKKSASFCCWTSKPEKPTAALTSSNNSTSNNSNNSKNSNSAAVSSSEERAAENTTPRQSWREEYHAANEEDRAEGANSGDTAEVFSPGFELPFNTAAPKSVSAHPTSQSAKELTPAVELPYQGCDV